MKMPFVMSLRTVLPVVVVLLGGGLAWAADDGGLLRDAGFEAMPVGEAAGEPGDGEPWHVTQSEAATYARIQADAARQGERGAELRRARSVFATLAQVVPDVSPDVYELTVWARGEGEMVLVAGQQRRRLALSDDWRQYSFAFEVEARQDVRVGFEALGVAQLDDAALRPADAAMRAAWRRQEQVREQLGFVPDAASAQRLADGGLREPWAVPDEPVQWTHRVVYYDPRYEHRGGAGPSDVLADYLAEHGFEVKDAPALGEWMRERIEQGAYGSVAVMAKGVAPTSVFEVDKGSETTLARYLRAGGRVAWISGTPLYRSQNETQPTAIGRSKGLSETLGIRSGATTTRAWDFARRQLPERTELGERWGLPDDGVATLGAYEEDVTAALTRLYDEELEVAVAGGWFKNLNSDYPWSGFVYNGRTMNLNNPRHLEAVYRFALFAGEPVEAPRATAGEVVEPTWRVSVKLDPATDRATYLRGERVPVNVALAADAGVGGEAQSVNITVTQGAETLASHAVRLGGVSAEALAEQADRIAWAIDTADLAVGAYALRVTVWGESSVLARAERELAVRPDRPEPTFFYGAWATPGDNEYRNRLLLDGLAEHGLHTMATDRTPAAFLDGLMRRDLRFSLRAEGRAHEVGPHEGEGSLRRAPDGTPATRRGRAYRSLLSPMFRERVRADVAEQLSGLDDWPNVWPYAMTADDYALFYGLDYSDIAREAFKEKTGLDAPVPSEIYDLPADRLSKHFRIEREPGIVAEDDPWLLWTQFTSREIGGGYNAAAMAGAREAIPDVRLGPVPGSMQWPLWRPGGQYPADHFGGDRFNLLYYYYYLNYWQPSVAALYWDHVARLGNRELPLWVTAGLVNINERSYYRNMFHLHLAGGVQGINYYTYRDSTERPRALAEVGRLSREIVQPLYPLLGELRPARHRVALLLPNTTAMYENTYALAAVYPFANLLAAQIDVELTSEEEAMAGELERYDTVLLWHAKHLRRAGYDALVDYIEQGGKVLVDASTPIDIPGATRLDLDLAMGRDGLSEMEQDPQFSFPRSSEDYLIPERVRAIREALEPHCPIVIDADDMHLISRRAQAAGVPYIWLTHLHRHEDYVHQRERIMGEQRGRPGAVAEAEAYVDGKADAAGDRYEGAITIPAGHVPYDVFAGRRLDAEPVDDGQRLRVPVSMSYLGGTLIALYPRAVDRVEIVVPDALKRGEAGELIVRVLDADGQPLPGHHPIDLTIRHPRQTFEQWTGSHITDAGELALPVRPANNHPVGVWIVEAKEQASGVTSRATFRVR